MFYVYKKSTGEFSGSGVTEIENDDYGSTQVPVPEYDTGIAAWDGVRWRNVSKRVDVVSPRQIRLALLGAGIDLAMIDKSLADNPAAVITWEYATEIHRDDPMLNAMAESLGINQEQVSALFETARFL